MNPNKLIEELGLTGTLEMMGSTPNLRVAQCSPEGAYTPIAEGLNRTEACWFIRGYSAASVE